MHVRWTDTWTDGLPPQWDSMMQQEAPSCRHKRTGTTDGPIFKLPSAVSFTVRARKDSILEEGEEDTGTAPAASLSMRRAWRA